jgi:hypothetical protein
MVILRAQFLRGYAELPLLPPPPQPEIISVAKIDTNKNAFFMCIYAYIND